MKNWNRNIDLIRELAVKDLKIQYSRPSLGFFWAFLSPLFMVAIFYLVFGVILKVRIESAPFVLYLMTGVFPWLFFQSSVNKSVTSLMDNRNLIKESNFQHWLIPVSIVCANAVNFLPSLLVIVITSFIMAGGIPGFIAFLPFILATHIVFTAGLSIIVSLLYVRWRDFKYILEPVLLLLFYLTPAVYSLSIVKNSFPPLLFKLYAYNPLVGILTLYRMALLKGFADSAGTCVNLSYVIIIQFIFTMLVLTAGYYLYRRDKRYINDYLAY